MIKAHSCNLPPHHGKHPNPDRHRHQHHRQHPAHDPPQHSVARRLLRVAPCTQQLPQLPHILLRPRIREAKPSHRPPRAQFARFLHQSAHHHPVRDPLLRLRPQPPHHVPTFPCHSPFPPPPR